MQRVFESLVVYSGDSCIQWLRFQYHRDWKTRQSPDAQASLERLQVQAGQRGQGAVTSHTAQQQDGSSTEGPGGRAEQSGVGGWEGGRVILREKMPPHQLSEGLLITSPGEGGEMGAGGWRSRGKGGGLKGYS